jgi:hypothetical protein
MPLGCESRQRVAVQRRPHGQPTYGLTCTGTGAAALVGKHPCWHAYRSLSIGNVVYYYRIRSNPRMVPYRDRPQYFGPRTNVYMTTDFRHAMVVSTNGDLLEQQTIWPDSGVRMNDDAIRMRQQQTAAQFAIERDVGASHYAPTSVSQYCARSG